MTQDLAEQITQAVTTIPAHPGFRLLTVWNCDESREEWEAGFPLLTVLPIVAWRVVPDAQGCAAEGKAWARPVTVELASTAWSASRAVGIEAPDGTVTDLSGDETFPDRAAFLEYARDEGRRFWDAEERSLKVVA